MMLSGNVADVLRCAGDMLRLVTDWQRLKDDKLPTTAQAYEGSVGVWRFLVVRYELINDIEKMIGYGYDGTITRSSPGTLVMRMPREMAERAGKLAEKAVTS